MLEELTWEQFCGWLAYAEVEPFGERRADLRMGIEASSIVNTLRAVNSVKRLPKSKLSKPTDFIPKFGDPEEIEAKKSALSDPDAWARMVGDLKHRVAGQARGEYREVN